MGEQLNPDELEVFSRFTGRTAPPPQRGALVTAYKGAGVPNFNRPLNYPRISVA